MIYPSGKTSLLGCFQTKMVNNVLAILYLFVDRKILNNKLKKSFTIFSTDLNMTEKMSIQAGRTSLFSFT